MRKGFFWVFIFGFGFFTICGLGCSKAQNEVPTYSLSNQGQIQGKVYDLYASNCYAERYAQIAGAKIYIGSQETASAADGSYSFSNIPQGGTAITISAEGYYPQTISVDRNVINIYLLGLAGNQSTYEASTGIISGTVYGLSSEEIHLSGSAYSKEFASYKFTYNPSIYRYSMTEAPIEKETYVFADYPRNGDILKRIYAYKKVDVSNGSCEADLDFGFSNNFLTVEAAAPTGYAHPSVNLYIYNGAHPVKSIYSKTIQDNNPLTINSLPPLQSGDCYGASVSSYNSTFGLQCPSKTLYKYGIGDNEKVSFDLTLVPDIVLNGPLSLETISSNPTFSWTPVDGEDVVYVVYLYGSSRYPWLVWTGAAKGNSISLPKEVDLDNQGTQYYFWFVEATKGDNLDVADLGKTTAQSYIEWISVSEPRSFTYAKQ